ncbi:hypothetical protein KAFR_0D00670 [Kazachstania africana CBS 2517]|uniref:Transcription initiation factor TFIID subunit 2 n=1 Tax=Kazachstania africana (strain ATCC 22294 / BCRC 22015 / CBS 2517 / CECT 1963 / NBRC 1671 / NRRL Y-8276) TaxID=1071382 RepID=H2ATL4_KAZAF|nr:hypothetical protein KAFR_0D00670 [Kazachstania africana CBS 2517]CCF57714.1 hypothetical protein KAFR_0D00670 [Kazachstania africana CBS 2517]
MSFSIRATPRSGGQSQPLSMGVENFRTFKVAHQRVSLDVNLSTHKIKGTVDIILIPLIQNLDYITLDCKEMKITDVLIENRRCEHYIHDDTYKSLLTRYTSQPDEDILYNHNSIEQSHFFREKFADLNEKPEERTKSQLTVKVPSFIKITLQDASSLTNYTPITPSIRGTPIFQEEVFTPITLKVEYEIENPRNGIVFDTILEEHPHLWNAYTTNSELCASASYWVPCIDLFDEKSTWEIEISVPKKVKDIGITKIVGQQQKSNNNHLTTNKKVDSRSGLNNIDYDDEEEEYDILEEEDTENPMNRDIVVCCSEFSTVRELNHPTDLSKRIFSFQIFNPVAPHHVGWAIGAFNTWELPSLVPYEEKAEIDEQDENDDFNNNNNVNNNHIQHEVVDDIDSNDIIPIHVYTLPTHDVDEKTVINSTIVCQKIIDFYSKEFGSYPFTSYSLVFLPTLLNENMDFASLTLCNSRLLYPPKLLDEVFPTTEKLAWSLASQWSGVNITPLDINDIWCCLGMAGYMVFQFTKILYGNNELKYRLKINSEAIVDEDWEKSPIGSTFHNSSRPISIISKELDFIKLKAPMVLYILDKRMTKTERSFGMSRVLPKIFLQAMSGDLPNNSLSASHFQHICERVNKNKLEYFFQQWVYGSGVPIFRVTQRFNKKRMVIELGIRQCQNTELGQDKTVGSSGFFNSALHHLKHEEKDIVPFFTGSMTIRIHEADGTPYEHIVELKDIFTKIDIQYNTKYKKLRGRRMASTLKLNASTSNLQDDFIDGSVVDKDEEVQKFGTVLSSEEDCKKWNLENLTKTTEGNELQKQNEVFEWIRIDSDFEWICKMYINQPDYMFASQLQQDGDVEAQFESIKYFEDVTVNANKNSLIYSSILARTAMDDRYFYGIRLEACKALAKFIYRPEEIFLGGSRHLIKIFQTLFCFEDSNIPKNNRFDSFQKYLLQREIPSFLSSVRTEQNDCPSFVKQFLLDILTYNENAENPFDDIIYLTRLINNVVTCTINDKEDKSFLKKVVEQLNRYENLDTWIPTYQVKLMKTILEEKLRLNIAGLYDFGNLKKYLQYSLNYDTLSSKYPEDLPRLREGFQDIALTSFKIMLLQGGIKNKYSLEYFFQSLCFIPDVYIRGNLVDTFIEVIEIIATKKMTHTLDDDITFLIEKINPAQINIENEDEISALMMGATDFELNDRKTQLMRSTIEGLLILLRRNFEDYEPLKKILWDVLHMPVLSLYQRKRLFDIARVLYTLTDSFQVKLPAPRTKKLVAKYIGGSKVIIKRDGILKVHLSASKAKLSGITSSGSTAPHEVSSAAKVKTPTSTKAKITLTKPSKKVIKPVVNKVGFLPIRFLRLSDKYRKVNISSVPFSDNVTIVKANARSFTVKVKLPKKK